MLSLLIGGLTVLSFNFNPAKTLQPAQGYRLYQPVVMEQHEVFRGAYTGGDIPVDIARPNQRIVIK